ncbi:unnamed protein product, partial [Urochloa humidicola]
PHPSIPTLLSISPPQIHSPPVSTLCGGARDGCGDGVGAGAGVLFFSMARAAVLLPRQVVEPCRLLLHDVDQWGRRLGGTGAWSLRASSADRCSHSITFLHMSRSGARQRLRSWRPWALQGRRGRHSGAGSGLQAADLGFRPRKLRGCQLASPAISEHGPR